jgi:hypothetical protein
MFTSSIPTKLSTLLLLLSNRDDACLTSLSNDDATMTSSGQNVELHAKYSTSTEHNPPEANYCCGRSNGKPKIGYHCSDAHYKN